MNTGPDKSAALRRRNGWLLVLALGLAFWQHALARRPARAQTDPAAAERYPCNSRGVYCDYITHLGVDYLNDDSPPPHAFNVSSGTLAAGDTARFYVYALTDGFPYANVTSEFESNPCPGKRPFGHLTVKAAPGSRSVPGRVRVYSQDGFATVTYTPKRQESVDRTALLTFDYSCGFTGRYRYTFTLSIPGRRSAQAVERAQ